MKQKFILSCVRSILPTLLASMLFAPPQLRAASDVAPDSNTLLYWKFNEEAAPAPTSFADSTANGRNGTPRNIGGTEITPGAAGVLGNGIYTAGPNISGQNIVYYQGLADTHFPTFEFTLQVWIKNPVATGGDATFGNLIAMQRMASNSLVWSLGVVPGTTDGAVKLRLATGPAPLMTTGDIDFGSDEWWMVALVASATANPAKQDFKIYIAPNNATSLTLVGNFTNAATANYGTPGSSASFSIGGDGLLTNPASVLNRRFEGYIDEVSYSNVARSEAYLLSSVVPEPSSLGMLTLGFAAVLGFRSVRRRRV